MTANARWHRLPRHRTVPAWTVLALVLLLGVAVLLVCLTFLPVAIVYGRWAYMTIRCGRQPLAISDFAASYSYQLPGDSTYRRDSLFRDYVCSEADARRKGYAR